MEIVQASFQASFDSRVERLQDAELAELRTIFRYFDTDGDGAVEADQACRMFALLGLDVNVAHVQELGEVYLSEFMKIVDSHVAATHVGARDRGEAETGPMDSASATEINAFARRPTSAEDEAVSAARRDDVLRQDLALSAESIQQRNEKLWEDEWKLLDTYRRGQVSLSELRIFLASCASTLSLYDTVRFVETYGGTGENDSMEDLVLTRTGFIKFRREYTAKNGAVSESTYSSDDGDADGEATAVDMDQQLPDLTASDISPQNNAGNSGDTVAVRPQALQGGGRGPSEDVYNSDNCALSAREDTALEVDPTAFLESDESDEEVEPNAQADDDAGAL